MAEVEQILGPEVEEISSPPDVFTFQVPATGGHYYLAVEAMNEDEAVGKAHKLSQSRILRRATGPPSQMTSYIEGIDRLRVPGDFRERFREFGYAHRFVKGRPKLYHERHGHRGLLPE